MKTSELSNNSFTREDPNESKKFRKSVRFQVYDAKTMESLVEMRQAMHEKLNEINESFTRVRSPPKLTPEQHRAKLMKRMLKFVDTLEDKFQSCQ